MRVRKPRGSAKTGEDSPDIGLLQAKMAAMRTMPDAVKYQKMMGMISGFRERIDGTDRNGVESIVKEMKAYFERLRGEDPVLYEASEVHRKTLAESVLRKFGFEAKIN